MQLPMLLQTLIPKIDHARAVQQLRKAGHLALILPYLKQVRAGVYCSRVFGGSWYMYERLR